MDKWFEEFGITYPECKQTGQCCRFASPSISTEELKNKLANGDEFAKDFFSIFIPYKNLEEVRKINPDLVEKSIKACEKPDSKVKPEQLVFYYCRFLEGKNKCLIYEDRPGLCRDFPHSPFTILSETCGYYKWSIECKNKYNQIKETLEILKNEKKELENLKYQQKVLKTLSLLKKLPKTHKAIVLIPSLSLISPGKSSLYKQ